MIDITKDSLTDLWCKSCTNAQDQDVFNSFGSSEMPGFGIRINDKISLTIEGVTSAKLYSINLILSDVIRYKSFNIEEVDYMSFLDYWETGSNHASKIIQEKLIKEGLQAFDELINNK